MEQKKQIRPKRRDGERENRRRGIMRQSVRSNESRISRGNNDRNTEMKLLQSNPLLHQRQTKQNHLNSSFVPTEPCRLGSRRCRRRDRLQGNNPSFSTQQKSSITLQSKAPGFICLEDTARERERERDSGGENSNILKYARETKKVHGRGSGLQKSNQKLN